MSEETNIEQQPAIEQNNIAVNPFDEQSWVENPVNAGSETLQAKLSQDVPSEQSQGQQQQAAETEEEIYDANEYLKQKLGFDDWDSAAQQIEELRKARESAGGLEFQNEESRKFYEYAKEQKEEELLNFLQEKRKVEKLANAEIKDANTAAEIIKLSMYQKNRDLDPSEIEFLFNEKFQKPAKPEQAYDELDSDYEARVANWENRVNEIEKKLVIEAKLAKPELEKLRSSLILPDINPKEPEYVPTQEDLDAQKRYMDSYFGAVDNTIKEFEGFNVAVKDEGVDFSVAYVPSDEEKQVVAKQMRDFAENNLDANMLFAERWVNDDGTINVKQMTKDLFLLQNEGKISQKYVNDAANKRLALHLKKQSNIDISSTNQSGTFTPNNAQSEMDKLAAVMFAK